METYAAVGIPQYLQVLALQIISDIGQIDTPGGTAANDALNEDFREGPIPGLTASLAMAAAALGPVQVVVVQVAKIPAQLLHGPLVGDLAQDVRLHLPDQHPREALSSHVFS